MIFGDCFEVAHLSIHRIDVYKRQIFHQIQLPEIPFLLTMPATKSGVSAAKVVATIDVPATHQVKLRPPKK